MDREYARKRGPMHAIGFKKDAVVNCLTMPYLFPLCLAMDELSRITLTSSSIPGAPDPR